MDNLFENLLVSSPNDGGLFFINNENVYQLDNFNSTGLSVKDRTVLRGVQPSMMQLYDTDLFEFTNNEMPFDDIHDVYLDDDSIYLVATSNNEIVKFDSYGKELKRWIFPGENDAFHINSLVRWNGKIVFSAFGEFAEHRGYKGKTEKSGFVQDLLNEKRLITGLSQPHSLVPIGQNLLLANSEYKELLEFGPSGNLVRTLTLDGYTRGICIFNNTIYVGLSCSRNIQNPGVNTATVVALDLDSWEEKGRVHLPIPEIYAIQCISNSDNTIHILANIASNASKILASSVTDRNGQIAYLTQLQAERDGQIVNMRQVISERDEQIANLNQVIAERDAQIDYLTQAHKVRGEQIVDLSQTLAERDAHIARIISSRSWHITKPLRFVGWLSRGEFSFAFDSLRKALRRRELKKIDIRITSASARVNRTNPVAVVLPVYRDTKMTKDCIVSAIPSILNIPDAILVIINDASPEPDMASMLENMAARWPKRIEILTNEFNMGFVVTVNRGMKYHNQHDVVILNSDVILPMKWLERLIDEAYCRPRVATVTPLSNNTTICTFPEFLQDNPLPFGLSVDEVDAVFRNTRMPNVEAPTGIGFCMYIRRDCLDDVGYFDESRFGRGYGEENDFCQRAIKKGWVNLITPNLYVYHKGGVSFGSEKNSLIENAIRSIDELHPTYNRDVQLFIQSDPLRESRLQRLIGLMAGLAIPKVLYVSHGLGGGVVQYISELSDYLYSEGLAFPLVLTPQGLDDICTLRFGFKATSDEIVINFPQDFNYLVWVLRTIGVTLIHFNHALNVHPLLFQLPKELNIKYYLTIHDFYLLNGNPTLTDERGIFVEFNKEDFLNPMHSLPGGVSLKDWRDNCRCFVEGAEIVIYPSVATKRLFNDHFKIKHSVVARHLEVVRDINNPPKSFVPKSSYVIGALGALGREKGADYYEEIAVCASKADMPLEFVLIGYAYRTLEKVKTTGPYDANEIMGLVHKHECDILIFPARCPETYSYTLSYALESGLSIVAPALGAFPERLSERGHVMLFEHGTPPDILLAQLMDFIAELEAGQTHRAPKYNEESSVISFYETNYLKDVPIISNESDSQSGKAIQDKFNMLFARRPTRSRGIRESILHKIWQVYSIPSVARMASMLPYELRRSLKRTLSKKPMHNIVGKK